MASFKFFKLSSYLVFCQDYYWYLPDTVQAKSYKVQAAAKNNYKIYF